MSERVKRWSPGPWRVDVPNLSYEYSTGIHSKDYVVCDVCDDFPNVGDSGSHEANANLIAAAPALVEALESLMNLESRDRVMPVGPEWDAARAALALAYGETQ